MKWHGTSQGYATKREAQGNERGRKQQQSARKNAFSWQKTAACTKNRQKTAKTLWTPCERMWTQCKPTMNSTWNFLNSVWIKHELNAKFCELGVNEAWTPCEQNVNFLWTGTTSRTWKQCEMRREQWARRGLPFGRMKTENHRSDTFIVGIIGTKFRMSAHEMADRRRMATEFIPDSTVRIPLFNKQRCTRTTHIADGSAARRLAAWRAAQVFLEIGNAEGNGKGRIVEEHTGQILVKEAHRHKKRYRENIQQSWYVIKTVFLVCSQRFGVHQNNNVITRPQQQKYLCSSVVVWWWKTLPSWK